MAFPERLLKNEFGYDDEDEDEGVFEEQPVRPAYAQRLQFFGGNEVRVTWGTRVGIGGGR